MTNPICCNHDCNQGRNCPLRVKAREAVELPPLPTPFYFVTMAADSHINHTPYHTADQMNAHASAYALASLAAKDAEIGMLRAALAPFAALLQDHNSAGPDSKPIFGINRALLTLGDLRRAALTQGAKA